MADVTSDAALVRVLERARRLGFLGPGPVERQLRHAEGFADAAELYPGLEAGAPGGGPGPARILDLGSGGGVPGLVLAARAPGAEVVLLEAAVRRASFLREAVDELQWTGRVSVLEERAEHAARHPDHRRMYEVVTARSFGAPAVAAECGAPFLRPGGILVVSEPPAQQQEMTRWPAAPLRMLGLSVADPFHSGSGFGYARLRQASPCPDRWPRRNGVPAKRPLF